MLCKHCGKDSDAPIDSQENRKEIKNSIPLWFKSLLGFVGLIIAILIINIFLTKDLTDTVQDQLADIRDGDLAEAYEGYSSKRFKEATSFEAFKEFINKHPAFSENKLVQFKERNVNNDVGTLDCVMTTTGNKKLLVEYKLVKELDVWKVLSIRLEDSNKNPTEKEVALSNTENTHQKSSLKFTQFVLGSSLSPLGLIKSPTNTFKSDSGDIYLNVYLTDATAGEPLQVTFEHIDSHSILNPITTKVRNNGEEILSFVFSPPKENWPRGYYIIKASGAKKNTLGSVEFKID